MNDSGGGLSSAEVAARLAAARFPSHVEGASLDWVVPYGAIATRVAALSNARTILASVVSEFLGEPLLKDLSPFTFFGMFNGKVRRDERRSAAVALIEERLGILMPIPRDFQGAPHLNPRHWRFADDVPGATDIEWRCFEAALTLADELDERPESREALARAFDACRALKGIGDSNLPIALYWARPTRYLALDALMVGHLERAFGIRVPKGLTGETYLELVDEVARRLQAKDSPAKTFPELCVIAWREYRA